MFFLDLDQMLGRLFQNQGASLYHPHPESQKLHHRLSRFYTSGPDLSNRSPNRRVFSSLSKRQQTDLLLIRGPDLSL
jgi:hypothetical protein